MADWDLIFTDLAHRPVGEILNAKSRQFARPLRGLGSGSFQIRLDNPLADTIATCAGYVKVYRNNSIFMHGPIISAEESGDATGGSVAVNMVDAGWFLQKRYIGRSALGTTYTNLLGRDGVLFSALTDLNFVADTYVAPHTFINSGPLTTYTAGPWKTMLDTVKELASGDQGFDWYLTPLENYAAGAVTTNSMSQFIIKRLPNTNQQPEAIFEYGTGRSNISAYKRVTSRDMQANKVFHNAAAGPDAPGYPTVSAIAPRSITSWGLLEDLVQADLLDFSLRQQLVNRHRDVRQQPRQVLTFTPVSSLGSRVPNFGSDYSLGDWVRARIVFSGVTRLDAWLKVYGVNFTIDDLGVETSELTLVDPGDG